MLCSSACYATCDASRDKHRKPNLLCRMPNRPLPVSHVLCRARHSWPLEAGLALRAFGASPSEHQAHVPGALPRTTPKIRGVGSPNAAHLSRLHLTSRFWRNGRGLGVSPIGYPPKFCAWAQNDFGGGTGQPYMRLLHRKTAFAALLFRILLVYCINVLLPFLLEKVT